MEIDQDLIKYAINLFSEYIAKKNATLISENIALFSINYANRNETPFLLDSIFNTKVNEIVQLFKKSDFLKNSIKDKLINPSEICNLRLEELDPEKYKEILHRKALEEDKKNNQAASNAFTCKKCKMKRCQVSERQTRSGDESATVFITCLECGFSFTI
jgi:DNA-directed RNA polymerase subunit M/transcription elongation factor TFIIS